MDVIEETIPEFGDKIRKEFMLRPDTVFLNHASYGSMPRRVHEKQIRYLEELESYPDAWFRFNMYKYLDESKQTVAQFVGADFEDIFLMQNATKAINTILKAFPMTEQDAILITNLTYYAVKMTADVTAERVNGRVHELELTLPVNGSDEIIQQYEECLSQHKDIKIVVLDHITSPSTIVLPIKELTEVCHKYGAIVLIDGAQAPGQLPLDLQGYDADFYTGNFHKWVYCPRACAFLWRNPKRNQNWLKPLVTSAFDKDGLSKAFAYEGTKDDTPYICSADGIAYYHRIGGLKVITSYTKNLKNQAIEYLEQTWNTKRLQLPEDMVPPNIELVELPFIDGFSDQPDRFLELQHLIARKFNIQTFTVNLQDKLFIRLSIQVYNTMEDVVKLGQAVLRLTSNKSGSTCYKKLLLSVDKSLAPPTDSAGDANGSRQEVPFRY